MKKKLALVLWFVCLAAASHADTIISSAGATFPAPLYQKWIKLYSESTNVRLEYQAVGSGRGIQLLLSGRVDIGASDIFLSDTDLQKNTHSMLHIPTCIGAVAIIFNLPHEQTLKLTPELLSGMLSGKITRWDDPSLCSVNPELKNIPIPITPIYRSDSSGTTYILTDYLTKVSPDWKKRFGKGKTIPWPVGIGVNGNASASDMVTRIPGSVGYVSLTFAKEKGLPAALLQNRSGRYVKPSLESVSKAAEINLVTDNRVMLTDTEAPDGYPLSSFSYMLIYKEQSVHGPSIEKSRHISNFLSWVVHQGQQYSSELHYAPLPEQAVMNAEETIRSITFNDKPLN